MKKKTILLISLIFFFGCRSSHIDTIEVGKVINYGDFGFKINKNYNLFYSRVKIGMTADSQVKYYQHFDIKVPKNIKKWLYSGTAFILEYDDGQIVSIDAETEIRKEKITDWKEIPDNEISLQNIEEYYKSAHGKPWDYDAKIKPNRFTKAFNDGHTTIILFNIKKVNKNEFIDIKNSMEYIKSNRS